MPTQSQGREKRGHGETSEGERHLRETFGIKQIYDREPGIEIAANANSNLSNDDWKEETVKENFKKNPLVPASMGIGFVGLIFGAFGSYYQWGAKEAWAINTAPALFVLFFVFMSLCGAGMIFQFQKGCSRVTLVGLTLVTGSALAAQAGIFGAKGADIADAVVHSGKEATIVAAFAGCGLVSFLLVTLLTRLSCLKGNPGSTYWGVGTILTTSFTCVGGGIVWSTLLPTLNAGFPIFIGVGLLTGVFVFVCIASRSRDKQINGVDEIGFFKNNEARVAVSLFWSASASTLVGTFGCSALANSYVAFGVASGVLLTVFPIIYFLFFKHGLGELNFMGKLWKVGTISVASLSLTSITFGATSGVYGFCVAGGIALFVGISLSLVNCFCGGRTNGFWSNCMGAHALPVAGGGGV